LGAVLPPMTTNITGCQWEVNQVYETAYINMSYRLNCDFRTGAMLRLNRV
jgi:hypothetical protein